MSCRSVWFRSRFRTREFLSVCGFMASLALPGCGFDIVDETSGDRPTPNLQITVELGANQSVKAGSQFPEPIQVRATDSGLPFRGFLEFEYADAGTPPQVQFRGSNGSGKFVFTRKVGLTPGAFTVTVYHNHCPRLENLYGCARPVQVGTVVVNGQVIAP